MFDITISIVLYHTLEKEIEDIVNLINKSDLKKLIFLIDNSSNDYLKKISAYPNVEYYFNNNNYGYGKAHNIAIKRSEKLSKYHLIMNSDVDFDPLILNKAFSFMEANDDVAMVSPTVLLPNGELQHFCRQLPTPFDLFARRFAVGFLKRVFQKKMDQYILLHKDYTKIMNIPNLPGCFMFCRTTKLNEAGGFDENFFMYVEDVDLTRRLHHRAKTLYYPEIAIEHGLARGSYKISKLLLYHIKSTIYYFNKWGWFYDKERKKINKQL
jgi:GT2 family glycosyltransferase